METVPEEGGDGGSSRPVSAGAAAVLAARETSAPATVSSTLLQTLTSGKKRDLQGGGLQAHICVVSREQDVAGVMRAFRQADGFSAVANWSFAYRIPSPDEAQGGIIESCEDGVDEGCGEKMLGVLQRFELHGLLLVVSRWQDHGVTPGIELFGTILYSIVVERCKDLINNLKSAIGLTGADSRGQAEAQVMKVNKYFGPEGSFEFGHLPPVMEPHVPMKYGPNHFLSEGSLQRPASLPAQLFGGGDPRLWMENDKHLRQLTEEDLRALRFMRQPDIKTERVLAALCIVRGHRTAAGGSAAVRWGFYREAVRSPTIRTELLLFNASQVPLDAALRARQVLDGLESDNLRRVNAGAAALFDWVRGVIRWRLEGPPDEDDAAEMAVQPLPVREAPGPVRSFAASGGVGRKSPAYQRPGSLRRSSSHAELQCRRATVSVGMAIAS